MALFTFWSGTDQTKLPAIEGLSIGKTTDIPMLASLMNVDEQKIRQRFRDGHEAWAARWHDTPVSFGWISRGLVRIGELSKEIELSKGNAYLWNFRTLEYYRGLGYYPQLLHNILLKEQKISNRIWIISAPENPASSKGIMKAGFKEVGELVFNYENEVVLSVTKMDDRVMAGANLIRVPITTTAARPCWRCVSGTMSKEASCDCYEQGVPCRCGDNETKATGKIPVLGITALLILTCFFSIKSYAQGTQHWFRREFGITHSSIYDNGHSLARYKGTGAQFQLGLDKEKVKRFRQLTVGLAWTPLKANVIDSKERSSATQGNLTINYSYLKKLRPTQNGKFKVAVGAASFMDANVRYYSKLINNQFGWDLNMGLNVVGRVKYDFAFKNKSYTISYQLGIPLIAYNQSPNYLGSYPVSSAFNSGEVADWLSLGRTILLVSDNYWYLHQQLSLDRNLTNGNKLRITCRWDYSNNGYKTHRYQNLTTGVTIGFLTSFSKNQ